MIVLDLPAQGVVHPGAEALRPTLRHLFATGCQHVGLYGRRQALPVRHTNMLLPRDDRGTVCSGRRDSLEHIQPSRPTGGKCRRKHPGERRDDDNEHQPAYR